MAADLAILLMGPHWTGYYVFTSSNFLYGVGIFASTWIAFEMTWADPIKLLAEYNIEWSEQLGKELFNFFMFGASIVATF